MPGASESRMYLASVPGLRLRSRRVGSGTAAARGLSLRFPFPVFRFPFLLSPIRLHITARDDRRRTTQAAAIVPER